MMDWNGDGKVDAEDWMLTEIILDEDEGGGGGKPSGSCLASLLLILTLPVFGVLFVGYIL